MAFLLDIKGMDRVSRRLEELAKEVGPAARVALREEAEIEMTEAKRRTPVLTGALRASGNVSQEAFELAVHLRFGGPAASYAVYVHENLEAFHRVGQAKYLESVIVESAPHFPERVSRRIAAILRAGA